MDFSNPAVGDAAAIDALLDDCFGTDRRQRTAYRLRAGAEPIAGPSCVVRAGGRVVASVQYWPVALIDAADSRFDLTLLGPIGVTPSARGRGIGIALMEHSLAIADRLHCGPVVLVGDVDYYGRFGFGAAATQHWRLPGPVDQQRVLLRNPAGVALPVAAALVARHTAYNPAIIG